MTARILPAKSGGLTQVKNSLRVSQRYPDIIGAVNVKRRSSATGENYAGQYVLRPNLPRHCLMLVGRTTETVASYSCSLDSCNSSDLSLSPPILPRLPLRLLQYDFKYSSRANAIGLKSGLSGDALLSGFLVMGHAFGFVLRCYRIFTSSGLCFLSQSLSAAFMRVCQPLPVALNASTTSGEQRKVTRTLGFIAFGRPSLTSFSPSYNAAPEKNSSSSSGASSGSVQVFFKSCAFAFIGFPHGDNTPHVTAWRPDQDYNAPVEFSGCYVSCLAVILAYILSGEMFARKHLTSPRKIKAAPVKRPVAFVIVEVNFHVIIVRTINNFANCLHWLTFPLHPLFVLSFCFDQKSAYFTTTAASEREARLQLPAVRLVLIARIRMEVHNHD